MLLLVDHCDITAEKLKFRIKYWQEYDGSENACSEVICVYTSDQLKDILYADKVIIANFFKARQVSFHELPSQDLSGLSYFFNSDVENIHLKFYTIFHPL